MDWMDLMGPEERERDYGAQWYYFSPLLPMMMEETFVYAFDGSLDFHYRNHMHAFTPARPWISILPNNFHWRMRIWHMRGQTMIHVVSWWHFVLNRKCIVHFKFLVLYVFINTWQSSSFYKCRLIYYTFYPSSLLHHDHLSLTRMGRCIR